MVYMSKHTRYHTPSSVASTGRSAPQVTSVDFSKDGDWIRSNCDGGQLHMWDSNKGKHQVPFHSTATYRHIGY